MLYWWWLLLCLNSFVIRRGKQSGGQGWARLRTTRRRKFLAGSYTSGKPDGICSASQPVVRDSQIACDLWIHFEAKATSCEQLRQRRAVAHDTPRTNVRPSPGKLFPPPLRPEKTTCHPPHQITNLQIKTNA